MAIDVEGKALESVIKEEIYKKHCDREIDKLIVDIVFDTDHIENKSDIIRRLAEKIGHTFDSARGMVRAFIKKMVVLERLCC
ncbi:MULTISPECIES: hypothetical protein [Bacillus]|uniref:hypothetical protein n=1 Tax=Bacillus TaxID=1386 RepID=UPI001E5AB5A7|nr:MULTISPECIES: hypothetical protein [Bacillus]